MNTQVLDPSRLNALLDRAIGDLAAGYAGVMVSIGAKLGLYRAMAGVGPLSAAQLAERTGCAERYVREWLAGQAAGGYIDHHADSATYELRPEQAMVFADETSPVYLPHAWNVPASMWFDEHKTIDAFRTGNGVAWGDHDARLYCGVAAFYRNAYRASLVPEWIPALEGATEALQRGIRVADVGCGHGHSTILMAQAFPASRFFGYDVHPASIEAARANAAAAGVGERVTFEVANATSYPGQGFGLICFFDCLHDMGDPVAAAAHAARSLSDTGTVMLVEPFARDSVEGNLNPIGRLYYSASTALCCAHAVSEGGKLVLGAQAGERRLGEVFRSAGFSHFRKAAETPFNLILEARVGAAS